MKLRIAVRQLVPLCAVALILVSCPDGSPPHSIEGEWVNNDPDSMILTRIIIEQGPDDTTIHPYSSCIPVECDWGTKVATSDDNPNTWGFMHAIYSFDDWHVTFSIDLEEGVLWIYGAYAFDAPEEQDFGTLESFHRVD
jgi:hypothetical protein